MTEQDVERREFEKAYLDAYQPNTRYAMPKEDILRKHPDGRYEFDCVSDAYSGWKAALAAMSNTPLKDDLDPKEGALALCSLGYLGLIEGQRDGRWHGKSMYDHTKSWSSSKPRVLGYMPNKHEKALAVVREQTKKAADYLDKLYDSGIPHAGVASDELRKALSTIDEIVGEK